MANNNKKRKHSRALFEVISKSQNYGRASAGNGDRLHRRGFFSAARLWLSGGERGTSSAIATTAAKIAEPAVPVADIAAALAPVPVAAAETVVEEPQDQEIAQDYPELESGERAQNLAVAVDSDRRQIALRMSYTVAIVGGFALVVVVILAIMVGQRLNHGGAPLLAQTTTDELRKGPAHREVLDPPRRSATVVTGPSSVADAGSTARSSNPRPTGGAQGDGQQQQQAQTPAPSAVPADGKRYLNLNYVIIQGYAESQMKMAEEARDFLNREGVPCTVEKDVKGFSKITVVGLEGFEHKSAPEVAAYCQRIKQLSSKYVGNNARSYKAFDPVVVKWLKAE
jgi:hypothetical protein